jgi:hypothetical protein
MNFVQAKKAEDRLRRHEGSNQEQARNDECIARKDDGVPRSDDACQENMKSNL